MKAVSASSIAVCDQVYCGCSGWVRRCGTTTFITRTRRVPVGRSPRNVRARYGSSTALSSCTTRRVSSTVSHNDRGAPGHPDDKSRPTRHAFGGRTCSAAGWNRCRHVSGAPFSRAAGLIPSTTGHAS